MIERVRRQLRRVPRAGRVCFLIAFVNAVIWSVVVPPFQVPDETTHFAYAQYLAETGKPPSQGPGSAVSAQEQAALDGLHFQQVIGRADIRPIGTHVEDAALRAALAAKPSPVGAGGVSSITNQPPLYYALEAIPYWLSPSHDIFARLQAMRLVSALLAALTVLAVFLFLRELMPGTPWAWTVGALAVAFQPMFGFISAGVQGDNLLFFSSAATFLSIAYAYRRGLTPVRGAAIGAATACGLLGKLTFVAFVPGIALALLVLTWRALPKGRREALLGLRTAVTIAVLPAVAYGVLNVAVWHRGSPSAGGLAIASATGAVGHVINFRETLVYTWQLYLPRLWFMKPEFAYFPPRDVWLNGSIGHFGWLDYTFPAWVYTLAQSVIIAIALLALSFLVRSWARIRPLLGLLGCYAVMIAGLLGAIGYAGIRYRAANGYPFEQARYLFPLLVFYGLLIALAARGAGRRWGPVLGAVLVVLAMAHTLFAMTLTVSRYYG